MLLFLVKTWTNVNLTQIYQNYLAVNRLNTVKHLTITWFFQWHTLHVRFSHIFVSFPAELFTIQWHEDMWRAQVVFPRCTRASNLFEGHSKNNEANVLQNGHKIIYLWYISPSFFLIRATMAQIESHITNIGKPSQQNKFPACNIFELPHYFWNDPWPSRIGV